jgi:hypothetical protein
MTLGAPAARRVGGRMCDPAEIAASWDLSELETESSLAAILG